MGLLFFRSLIYFPRLVTVYDLRFPGILAAPFKADPVSIVYSNAEPSGQIALLRLQIVAAKVTKILKARRRVEPVQPDLRLRCDVDELPAPLAPRDLGRFFAAEGPYH